MEILGYIASIFMGLSLGMIGGGGSILIVPILVYLFLINPLLATSYSLFVVGITALVGGFTYLKKGEVDLKTGLIFALPSFVGVYLTRLLVVPAVPELIFLTKEFVITKAFLIMMVFAVLMVAASVSMIKNKKETSSSMRLTTIQKMILIAVEGLVVGAVTGFVGAGGGFLIIPALVILVGMPMKIAVGTSLFIIATKSLIGFAGDLQRHAIIDWKLLLTISSIAIMGLFIGIYFSKKIPEKALKKGFGYFVLVMGAFILFDQIKKM